MPAVPTLGILIVPEMVIVPPDKPVPAVTEVTVPVPPVVMGVLVTEVTRPWASVVITGTWVEEPYVPGVPTFGI